MYNWGQMTVRERFKYSMKDLYIHQPGDTCITD